MKLSVFGLFWIEMIHNGIIDVQDSIKKNDYLF
jgi:hypothetical protein